MHKFSWNETKPEMPNLGKFFNNVVHKHQIGN